MDGARQRGQPPSTDLLERVRQLARSYGMDAETVQLALQHWVEAYDLTLPQTDPDD